MVWQAWRAHAHNEYSGAEFFIGGTVEWEKGKRKRGRNRKKEKGWGGGGARKGYSMISIPILLLGARAGYVCVGVWEVDRDGVDPISSMYGICMYGLHAAMWMYVCLWQTDGRRRHKVSSLYVVPRVYAPDATSSFFFRFCWFLSLVLWYLLLLTSRSRSRFRLLFRVVLRERMREKKMRNGAAGGGTRYS